MTTFDSIETLLGEQLKDVYSAEKQLTKALPKMAKSVSNQTLKEAFSANLSETEAQIRRLERIAEMLGIKLSGKKCKAMEGLIEEAQEALDADGDENLVDASIIAAAQRAGHYEISAYGSAIALAEKAGMQEVVELLRQSEEEESATDEKLSSICEDELLAEFEASSQKESEEEDKRELKSGRRKTSESNRQHGQNRGMSAKSKNK